MNPFQKIKSAVNKCQRFFINRTLQHKLINQGMTVISANCVGLLSCTIYISRLIRLL
ncbi:DUF1919 domain-containing protein [Haemophilus influenzae]